MKHLVFLLFAMGLPFLGMGQTRLQYNLEQGDRFEIVQQGEQMVVQHFPEQDHRLTNRIRGEMSLAVTGTAAEYFDLEVRFTELALYIHSNLEGTYLNVNTALPEAEQGEADQLFKNLLGVPFHVRMSPTGEILEVAGGKALVSRIVEAADLEDEFSEELMRTTMERDFGSEALSESFRQLTWFYPESRVSVGDQWNNRYQGNLASENSWTLSALDASSTAIVGEAKVRLNLDTAGTPSDLTGTQKTDILAFRGSGFAKEMEVRTEVEGYTAIAGEQVPTKISATIKYTLTHVQ